jgi:hypothetical protein
MQGAYCASQEDNIMATIDTSTLIVIGLCIGALLYWTFAAGAIV